MISNIFQCDGSGYVTTQGKALATSALATSALYLKMTGHNWGSL